MDKGARHLMDHFEVFGLPRRLSIDGGELQRKFYELSRRGHPDFHQGAPPERQAEILEASARIEYLVRLEEGRDTREGATVKPKAPPELLEEMFEIQEALQEAKSDGQLDAGAKETLIAQRDRLRARYEQEEARLRGPLSQAWDAAGPAERAGALTAFKESLAIRAYLRTVIDDIAEALGESEEGHVSHRRH